MVHMGLKSSTSHYTLFSQLCLKYKCYTANVSINVTFPCTRILVHVKDALDKGRRSVFVRTVDTDVLVILIAQFHTLSSIWTGLSFWVAFGIGKNFQLLSVNTICEYLGKQKCRALPFFHAFTGCDTTSAFLGKGKKSAWEAWKAYPEATEAFRFVNDSPFLLLEINTPVFDVLQRFVVIQDQPCYRCKHCSTRTLHKKRIGRLKTFPQQR